MSWVLVLYIYAGAMARGDSVALTNVPHATQQACQASGKQAELLVSGSMKSVRFICLKTN